MGYLEICNLVMTILTSALSLLTIHFVVFMVVGVFAKKKFPSAPRKGKYAVIVSARNEEKVVANLIDSVRKNDYPQENITIFVVAHNCTDLTAERARAAGAVVYEYNNPEERTKGYALRYLFQQIHSQYPTEPFDGFLMLDADNLLDKHYISKMNDAFLANDGKDVVVSYRNSKNFGTNVMTCMYGLLLLYGCRFEQRGRTVCGCSTRVSGTGFMFNPQTVEDGWNYVTLTEDWEFSADRIAKGQKIVYCDDAVFYDEQPTSLKVMFRQRLRWQRGHILVFFTKYATVLKSFFTPVKKGGTSSKGSAYDISVNILPLGVITFLLGVVQVILIALSPLFGYDAATVWLDFLMSVVRGAVAGYVAFALSAVLLFLLERKKIPKISLGIKIVATLCMPVFMALSVVLDFVALFARNLGWNVVPHNDTTDFDTIHNRMKKKVK